MLDSIQVPSRRKHSSVIDRGGFSRVRLARMRAALRRHVDSGQYPGLVALVWQRGREHVETIGTMAFDSTVPMRDDTIFRLASTTKPITAVGAMILVEECRLRLDDPVDDWLPELRNRRVLRTIESPLDDTVPAKRSITLRDLLTFRSGYGEVAFLAPTCPLQKALAEARLPLSVWPFAGTSDDLMRRLAGLPLAHQPGERWLYHMSAEILGVLMERVSGQSLGAYLDERIFEPARDDGHRLPRPGGEARSAAALLRHRYVTGKLVVLHEARGGYAARPGGFRIRCRRARLDRSGSTRLRSGTAAERRRRRRAHSVAAIDRADDHGPPHPRAESGFAVLRGLLGHPRLGPRHGDHYRAQRRRGFTGRFGWDGAFGTSWYVDRKEELVGVLMTQRSPDRLALPPVVFDFWNSAYQLIDR